MKIGVIGLGTIAQKAYLPVMMTEHDEVEWHLSTRNEEKLNQLGKQYRIDAAQLHTDWEALLEADMDAVFIHTPTPTHATIIEQMLNKGIHVFVDKPISDDLEQTKALIALAKEKNVLLTAGFNRRFAPKVQELKAIEDKNMIFFQKNQGNYTAHASRYRIYDMMIHPVDTALNMIDEPVQIINTGLVGSKDHFQRAWVLLASASTHLMVSINAESGARLETMEVQSPTQTVRVENLSEWTQYDEKKSIHQPFGDWDNTLYKRGFSSMIAAFLEAVRTNGENPVTLESAFTSHEVCETILTNAGL
ncbi:Gfo/Idh/MocA family protein [Marinilactibacillus kalidii]|uniref:Gfo/Idh/MocA family protein n=1 Tax=Marinilactibacillus kalidii TaxID=2820274 RepID=UPI001ABDE8C7|nr:Gfo/Idh/MocA family oxidoreductase [Marinilactibacillus kalidii]